MMRERGKESNVKTGKRARFQRNAGQGPHSVPQYLSHFEFVKLIHIPANPHGGESSSMKNMAKHIYSQQATDKMTHDHKRKGCSLVVSHVSTRGHNPRKIALCVLHKSAAITLENNL